MQFAPFDTRHYPTVGVRQGYAAWSGSYEDTVLDLMDIRLLGRLSAVDWTRAGRAVDLACGTGRIGAWLSRAGVRRIDGIDLTPEMLARAREKGVYDRLEQGDLRQTGFESGAYDLAVEVLADEHLPELGPLYTEAARLLSPSGRFVLVGYHPHFVMLGIPTHYDDEAGRSTAIETHLHLMSCHVRAAHDSGFRLAEMVEGLVDENWIAAKPKWSRYRNQPVSFALVWEKP